MELDADLAAHFDVSVGKVTSAIKNSKPKKPYHIRRVVSAIVPAAGATVIDLGDPPVGMLWNILQVILLGPDDHTVQANTSWVMYGGDSSNLNLAQVLRTSAASNPATIPGDFSFSDEVVWVHPSENLVIVAYGATPGLQLTAIAVIDEWIGEEA